MTDSERTDSSGYTWRLGQPLSIVTLNQISLESISMSRCSESYQLPVPDGIMTWTERADSDKYTHRCGASGAPSLSIVTFNQISRVSISMSRCSKTYQLQVQEGIMTERADNYTRRLGPRLSIVTVNQISLVSISMSWQLRPGGQKSGISWFDSRVSTDDDDLYVMMLRVIPTPSPRCDHD